MTARSWPPMRAPPTSITVSSAFTSRETSLKGCETRMASPTPGSTSKVAGSSPPLLPVMPMATRCAPGMAWGVRPSARIRSTTASISACVAPCRITTSMGAPPGARTP